MSALSTVVHGGRGRGRIDLPTLCSFAAGGLPSMLVPDRNLFCHRVLWRDGRLVAEGISERYTIMTLLGAQRFRLASGHAPFDIDRVFESLYSDHSWIVDAGDAGLLLWLTAQLAPERLPSLAASLQLDSLLDRCSDMRDGRTMELAWLLTGLSYAAEAAGKSRLSVAPLANAVYRRLEKNQGAHGFFGHQTTGNLRNRLRRHFGSFADQVYPIYAFTQFARAFGVASALGRATRCADAICRAQGPLGQWWWHYHAQRGRVVQRYPVYSVHQDGMAPLALFAVGEATGRDYDANIYKGLAWIEGSNELGTPLYDPAANVIWRSFYQPGRRAYLSVLWSMAGAADSAARAKDLRLLRECRPYHLGWLLYAFAGRK